MENASNIILKKGTLLYHGTDARFEEEFQDLQGPAWLSDAQSVATYFAKRQGGWGGQKRIITYRLNESISLVEIMSKTELEDLAEKYGFSTDDAECIKDGVSGCGLPGWVIPYNYPEGADILISDTGILSHVKTVTLPVA